MPGLILVVDDHTDVRDLLVALLGDEGYRTATARDGVEALAVARREPPDLILADLDLPRLAGADFCRAYREEDGAAPIVLMSAGDPGQIAATAEACGAVASIAKPFDIDHVLATVARWLGGPA